MKKIYWLLLAAFLLTLMVAGNEPVYADTGINVSKPSLENRAIQNLKVIVKDDQTQGGLHTGRLYGAQYQSNTY